MESRMQRMPLSERKVHLAQEVARYEREFAPQTAKERYRPRFHLAAPTGWLNDPNGLIHFKNQYHVFFQYSPFAVNGGMKMWGHYVSDDLVHFRYEGAPIVPDEGFDRDGVYSGCAVEKSGEMFVFYTGNVKEEGDHDYIHSGRGANVIRLSSDDGIHFSEKQWILSNADYPKECSNHVRDPKIFRGENGQWKMVLGARLLEEKGAVLEYESDDLEHFHFCKMHTTKEPFGYMWECPDVFLLDDKRILSVCPQGIPSEKERYQNQYQSGYFVDDFSMFREWDMGFDFYAPQTFETSDGRRILIGWAGVPDAKYSSNPDGETWQHCLTVPRELTWHENQVYQYPVREIEKLRESQLSFKEGSGTVPNGCGDIFITGLSGARGEVYIGEECKFTFDEKMLTLRFLGDSGAGRSIRRAVTSSVRQLRILLDVSIMEIYVNQGEVVLTSRFFPKEHDVIVRCDEIGCDIEAYRMEDSYETFSSDWGSVD